jgi:hypothetical protein
MAGNPAKYGTVCRIYMDLRGPENTPAEGEFIRTNGGSVYRVLEGRSSPSRPGRVYFTVRRTDPDDLERGAVIWPLFWYRR